MKFQMLLGGLGLSIGVAACEASYQPATSRVEDEIGACGANADPQVGVVCKLRYKWAGDQNAIYVGSEAFEKDGFDFAHCKWKMNCRSVDSAHHSTSDDETCISVVGTGCPEELVEGQYVADIKLPPGTMANQIDDLCKKVDVLFRTDEGCALLNHDVDRGEDLCCLPRAEPPPRDAGISLDARPIGVADAVALPVP